MHSTRKTFAVSAAMLTALLTFGSVFHVAAGAQDGKKQGAVEKTVISDISAVDTVVVNDTQSRQLKVVAAQAHDFALQSDAVGYIDFNQDRTVQVFSQFPGRVRQVFAKAGDDIKKGYLLFTIDSPDLVQAESNLISTAGIVALTTTALDRARKLIETQGNAQKDLDQAISDQQTAEGNYKAARDTVRIFGKSDEEMDWIIASRKVDGELRIVSPFPGRITTRNVSPGLLVQPGSTPAPFTVADISTVWMVANVAEDELPKLQIGQAVSVSVMAYPGRQFQGKITNIGASIDPATHRIPVRTEIRDPHHELRPQMLANFMIRTGISLRGIGIPINGVVREGDGTMTVFVTSDGHRFKRRPVKLGLMQNGLAQIIEGLSPGEKVVADGALFLSNALALQSR